MSKPSLKMIFGVIAAGAASGMTTVAAISALADASPTVFTVTTAIGGALGGLTTLFILSANNDKDNDQISKTPFTSEENNLQNIKPPS